MIESALQVPLLMAMGAGIALSNARGVAEALLGHDTPFVRTPKYQAVGTDRGWRARRWSVRLTGGRSMAVAEVGLAGYLMWCGFAAMGSPGGWLSVPFIVVFAAGYGYVGFTSMGIGEWWASRRGEVRLGLDAAA